MEWEPVHQIALLALLVGMVFGAVTSKTNFCTMGAVSDWVNIGSKDRLRAWFLAIGVAILVSQIMHATGMININNAFYLTPNFGWLGYVLGGFIFGIGMTLASGCGQRTLARVGGGNLKSVVVLTILGLTAYMTMRGLLALFRVNVVEVTNINLAKIDIADQGMGTLLAAATGLENAARVDLGLAILLGGGLVVFAFASKSFRGSFDNVLAGIVIGLLVPAGWYITGVVGFDDFEPMRFESLTFIGPTGESLMYLMTFTGSVINFGIAAVFGVILGSFLYAILSGRFYVETFSDHGDMVRHILGAVMMGFGGVLALGCTIGQGITGMSTLATGSLMALISIIFGCALTLKVEYYRLDDMTFFGALRQSLGDMRLLPARRQQD